MSGKVSTKHPAELWVEGRRLYESGLSLPAVAQKLGVSYGSVHNCAWLQNWGVRRNGRPPDPRCEEARAKRKRRKLEKEEKRLAEELVVLRAEKLEVVSSKDLRGASARAKQKVSELIEQTLEELGQEGVKPRERAAALNALGPILKLVHGWHKEPDLEAMQGAINLTLINTTPQQLRELAWSGEAQSSLEAERRSEGETE